METQPLIIIDPGHGGAGEPVGGSSPNRASGLGGEVLEKSLTLAIAEQLEQRLAGRVRTKLTRRADHNLGLVERAALGVQGEAQLFVSLHFNAWRDPQVDGTSVFVAREADERSRSFAEKLLRRVGPLHVAAAPDKQVYGIAERNLGVLPSLKSRGIPAAHVEVAFLSNPERARRLRDATHRQAVADALADAIEEQLGVNQVRAQSRWRRAMPLGRQVATFTLSASVGEGGENRAEDVRALKARLTALGFDWVGSGDTIDATTIATIKLFQSIKNSRNTIGGDGLVDVPGATYGWLQARNAPRWQEMPAGSAEQGFENYELSDTSDDHDFGTSWMADTIIAAGATYRNDYLSSHPNAALLSVNDVTKPRGGDTPDHAGHETGMACDLRLPRTGGGAGGITHTNSRYDQAAARAQLQALRAQPMMGAIFFNDPTLIAEGLCEQLAGHDNHIHFQINAPTRVDAEAEALGRGLGRGGEAATIMTVVSSDARIRSGPPGFDLTSNRIPQYTRIVVNRTNGNYADVTGVDGTHHGWTASSNLGTYYKDMPTLQRVALAPARPVAIDSSWPAARRELATTYNRIGGLLDAIATQLQVDTAAVLAVWQQESGGQEHTVNRAIIRFENHKLFDRWGDENTDEYDDHFQHGGRAPQTGASCDARWKCHRFRNGTSVPWSTLHPSGHSQSGTFVQDLQYAALERATALAGEDVALQCISYGGPQIMGSNYALIGYDSPRAMNDAFQAGERAQVLGFADFVQYKGNDDTRGRLVELMRDHDWAEFRRIYNGSASGGTEMGTFHTEATAFLPAATSQSLRRRAGRLARPFDIEPILYEVPLIPQPTKKSCWAGALAMVVSYHTNSSWMPEDMANAAGATLYQSYGLSVLNQVESTFGLTGIDLPSNMSFMPRPEEWHRWLQDHGPLWVTTRGAPAHAVVVHGIEGGLSEEGTRLTVSDPWKVQPYTNDPVEFVPPNPGARITYSYRDFAREFSNYMLSNRGHRRVMYLDPPPSLSARSESRRYRAYGRGEQVPIRYGVPNGVITDQFYRTPDERRALGRASGRSRHFGIDVSLGRQPSGGADDERRGLPVYATLRREVPLADINGARAVGEGNAAQTGLGLDAGDSGNATLQEAVVRVQPWASNSDGAYGGVIRLDCRYTYPRASGGTGELTLHIGFLHLITERFLPKDGSGNIISLETWNATGKGIGFGSEMVEGATLTGADIAAREILVGYLGATEFPHVHIQAAFSTDGRMPRSKRPRIDPAILFR